MVWRERRSEVTQQERSPAPAGAGTPAGSPDRSRLPPVPAPLPRGSRHRGLPRAAPGAGRLRGPRRAGPAALRGAGRDLRSALPDLGRRRRLPPAGGRGLRPQAPQGEGQSRPGGLRRPGPEGAHLRRRRLRAGRLPDLHRLLAGHRRRHHHAAPHPQPVQARRAGADHLRQPPQRRLVEEERDLHPAPLGGHERLDAGLQRQAPLGRQRRPQGPDLPRRDRRRRRPS